MSSIDDYKIGMTVYGEVTAIKPYGAFVSFDNGISGLIHISELSNGFVKEVSHFVNTGDHLMLKVIDIDKEHKQLRLSFKALSLNSHRHGKRVPFLGMPANKLGFASIKEKMPEWIGEKKHD